MTKIQPYELPLAGYSIESNDDPTLETVSLTLFVSGCPRSCLGCQNQNLQKIDFTKIIPLAKIKEIIIDRICLIKSVSFCGGDFLPFYQIQLEELVMFCISLNLRTILYTGEFFETIPNDLRCMLDIIVDGPFDNTKKTNKFPASSNQRVFMNGHLILPEDLKINGVNDESLDLKTKE